MNHPEANGHNIISYRSGLLRHSWLMLGLSTGPLDYPGVHHLSQKAYNQLNVVCTLPTCTCR